MVAENCVGCRTCPHRLPGSPRFDKVGEKTRIELSQRVGCEICLLVCPKNAITAVKKEGK